MIICSHLTFKTSEFYNNNVVFCEERSGMVVRKVRGIWIHCCFYRGSTFEKGFYSLLWRSCSL